MLFNWALRFEKQLGGIRLDHATSELALWLEKIQVATEKVYIDISPRGRVTTT